MGIFQENRLIHRRHQKKEKGWFETWIDDLSFPEKLVTILWCGIPYMIWMMVDSFGIAYKVLVVICVWILLTLFCYWFGNFMSNDERHWNY